MMSPTGRFYFCLILSVWILSGCARTETVCPPEAGAPPAIHRLDDLIQLPPPAPASSETIDVVVQGKNLKVNKLVDYPLCNDNWSGTVYVSCSVEVAEAELDAQSNPLFLKGCNLKIAPNTVVYVAAHNDAPFYKGCSCHTGSAPAP